MTEITYTIEAAGSASRQAKQALGGKRPYLAKLLRGGQREWAESHKRGAKGHPVFWLRNCVPGAIVEARIAWYDDSTKSGTFWAVLMSDGNLARLDRDEALRLVEGAALPQPEGPALIAAASAYRPLPSCFRTARDDAGKPAAAPAALTAEDDDDDGGLSLDEIAKMSPEEVQRRIRGE